MTPMRETTVPQPQTPNPCSPAGKLILDGSEEKSMNPARSALARGRGPARACGNHVENKVKFVDDGGR
jgi:hypothetical protein